VGLFGVSVDALLLLDLLGVPNGSAKCHKVIDFKVYKIKIWTNHDQSHPLPPAKNRTVQVDDLNHPCAISLVDR
jgi:hypothetical protein